MIFRENGKYKDKLYRSTLYRICPDLFAFRYPVCIHASCYMKASMCFGVHMYSSTFFRVHFSVHMQRMCNCKYVFPSC